MKGRGGFTLVEVLVAMVLLAVGLTGTMATLLLATRIQSRAWLLAEVGQRAREVADSVAAVGGGSGQEEIGRVRLRWSIPAGGWGQVEARFDDAGTDPLLVVEVRS